MANMRCDEVQDLASAWLDNELSEARASMVAEHEAQCEACHGYITDLRNMAEHMARYGREPVPPGLEERIRLTLAEEQGRLLVPAAAGFWRARASNGLPAWPLSVSSRSLAHGLSCGHLTRPRPLNTTPSRRISGPCCRTRQSRSYRATRTPCAPGSTARWSSR